MLLFFICSSSPMCGCVNTLLGVTQLLQGVEGGAEVCHHQRPSRVQGEGEEKIYWEPLPRWR